jgi:hemolysin activation/secretion protein
VMNAEVRWTPARFLDMTVFYDTGKVASRRKDLDFDDLQDSYGIGMRIVGPRGYAFSVEVAQSREHSARLLVGAGGTF